MNQSAYQLIEQYMLDCMPPNDIAHGRDHVYRVLYTALDIAQYEKQVDQNILIAACLLHDIGRKEQLENSALCHAQVGAKKAEQFLLEHGFSSDFSKRVASCIRAHRFRSENPPTTIEEKILFDADKVDVTGVTGIARTLGYQAQIGEPLYSVDESGRISDGTGDKVPSFFQEYKFKLEGLYSKFYTQRGRELAACRQQAAKDFYNSLLEEVQMPYELGKRALKAQILEDAEW
ncbi:MAG: HD domain-containing protein [Massiliimalia sp.]